ncbi:antigen LPMC-61 isoform X5 [Bactrocera neohumeralis]|uniref:antigen LPMC-61 isoform X5 n=1 Tax=Bactrocera neohumeralis TaxID=98809 RepID=UPI002165ED5B|nr:antigen LPMC-61 isoform X5 [Bactrocera neohumeralis]
MATVQRKLVHKQFNSPMGLYSQQNVKETLDRELKAFGADGIEVDPEITKTLANSAVLRAVEEEEQMKCGYKRVAWPPVSEERVVREFTPQPTSGHYPVSGSLPQQPGQQQQPQHLQQQQQPLQQQQQQQPAAPANQYRATSYDQYQAPPQAQKYPPHQGSQPPYAQQPYSQPQQQQQPSWAHNQPAQQYQPVQAPYQQRPPQQQYQAAPPSNYQSQAYHQTPQQQQQPQQYSTVPQSNQYNSYPQPQHVGQDQPDHQAQNLPQDYRGGSPGIITLRKEAPVTQKPAPVYNAQPATVSFQGGSNMRGDLKWPPPEYKEAAIRENEERRQLALGPVCRPRKVNRDYTTFFAKNALNSYYPSYKTPPGTQHMFA